MASYLRLGCLLALVGCSDPMSHEDGIWPEAGSAQLKNISSQTIGPGMGYGWGANPGNSGPRAAGVIQQYQTGSGQAASAAPGETAPSPASVN